MYLGAKDILGGQMAAMRCFILFKETVLYKKQSSELILVLNSVLCLSLKNI